MEFEATSIVEARGRARKEVTLLGQVADKAQVEDAVQRVIRAKYSSRADRLDNAKSMIDEAREIVEELKDEIQEWYDNLPENLQGSEKGSLLEDCVTNLETVADSLNEAEGN